MKLKKQDKLLKNLLDFQIINIILLFHLFHIIILEDCEKEFPIKLSSGECVLQYCTKDDYESKECSINNTIIQTQFPNNIIIVGEISFRYLNFITFSNKDMVLETSSFPTSNKRIFYGLKKNGRYYFKKDNSEEETPFNYLIADIEEEGKYESINYNLKKNGKEYIISIGRLDSYTELFDFDANKIFSKKSNELFGYSLYNMRPNLIEIDKEDNTFIFPSIAYVDGVFSGIIFKFDLNINSNTISLSDRNNIVIKNCFGEIASCFFVKAIEVVICFYGCINDGKESYFILAYDDDLHEVAKHFFTPTGFNKDLYFYSIYFRENAGAFIYYQTISDVSHPVIFFKKLNQSKDSFIDYFSENNSIILDNRFTFNTNYMSNDLIKINDNKLGFFTSSNNFQTLYIIILYFNNGNSGKNMKIRYYSIEIYKLLNYKISDDIKGYMFNDFIILGTSYCFIETCNSKNAYNYSSTLMMIGYPNKEDYELNIINYLNSDGNNSIDNLIFDLAENMTIDNNIFGYIYNGTKIINVEKSGYIYLVSSISNNVINKNNNNMLVKDEKIKIEFENNLYNKSEYKLEYSYIVIEPEYYESKNYSVYTYPEEDDINDINLFNSQRKPYIGKSIYYKIILDEDLTINCGDPKCGLCLEKDKSCITYIQYTEVVTESENPLTEKRTEPKIEEKTEIKTELIDDKTEFNACSEDEIINNKCKNGKINDEQIKKIYENLQSEITGNNTNLIIKTENVIFQLLSLEENNNQNYIDDEISSIDLGECLNILKKITNNPLKILKIDYKSEDLTSTFVQYEVYDSTGGKISLSACSDVNIKINVPKILDDKTLNIVTNLENSGYNYSNKNDSFYNDICSTYTSEDGKDVLLSDRYEDIYTPINNMYICQPGCQFISYNTTAKKAECDCKVQQKEAITNLKDISFNKDKIVDAFVGVLKNSNFLVLKCYKLLLIFSKLILNYGFIIMSIILLLNLILMIIYCIKGKNKISELIKYFIKNKFEDLNINKKIQKSKKSQNNIINLKKKNNNPKINNKKIVNKIDNNIKKEENNKTLKDLISNKGKNNRKKKRANSLMIINNNNLNNVKIKKRRNSIRTKNNFPPKKKDKNNKIFINNNVYNINLQRSNKSINTNLPSRNSLRSSTNIKRKSLRSSTSIKRKSLRSSTSKRIINASKNNYNFELSKSKFSYSDNERLELEKKTQNLNECTTKQKKVILNDQEMDMLEYKKALEIDKRTYFQYYFSLLKKKHLILFAFYPNHDYNLVPLKISLFLLAFSLYFTMNGFFFSDETMHEIYEDNSSFNILIQIPIIIYSSCITSVINVILRQLSLSENNILSIKKEKDYLFAVKKSKNVLKCLLIKFFIYFLFSLLVLLFCWYFISCFCAVYSNTQKILITDSFISFGLSMLYPIGLNLLPGFFRIPALRAKNKDKECLYKISKIIAII